MTFQCWVFVHPSLLLSVCCSHEFLCLPPFTRKASPIKPVSKMEFSIKEVDSSHCYISGRCIYQRGWSHLRGLHRKIVVRDFWRLDNIDELSEKFGRNRDSHMSKEILYVYNISCALLYGTHCVPLGGFNHPGIGRSCCVFFWLGMSHTWYWSLFL